MPRPGAKSAPPGALSLQSQFQKEVWEQHVRKELYQRLRPVRYFFRRPNARRIRGARRTHAATGGGFQPQRARTQPRAHCAGRAWASWRWLALYAVLPCRWTAAAAGENSGKITAHDFLDRCSWGSPEGGWDCETGEGGEARMSSEWLGGDRLAASGWMDAGRGDSHLSAFASRGPSHV